jgi:rubredoxin
MDVPSDKSCPNCSALEARVAALEAELAKARKNSANSSKPPSSDIVKPPRPGGASRRKRKRGGQPGHPRHERPPFTPEQIDERIDYTLTICPDCGGRTKPLLNVAPRIVQQVELVTSPIP